MKTLIRRRMMRRLIWVCTVCLCPTRGASGLFGLTVNTGRRATIIHIVSILKHPSMALRRYSSTLIHIYLISCKRACIEKKARQFSFLYVDLLKCAVFYLLVDFHTKLKITLFLYLLVNFHTKLKITFLFYIFLPNTV